MPIQDVLSESYGKKEAQLLERTKRAQLEMTQKVIDALNGAAAANKAAIHALIVHRVPVGAEMVDDPFMIVDQIGDDASITLGMLGVLNGCLNAIGLPRLCAVWEKVPDQVDNFVGFALYQPPEAV